MRKCYNHLLGTVVLLFFSQCRKRRSFTNENLIQDRQNNYFVGGAQTLMVNDLKVVRDPAKENKALRITVIVVVSQSSYIAWSFQVRCGPHRIP